MAYGLKYKASKTHENGDKYEVRIYRDGWTGASYGIGNLTRLSLSIQGDTAALTAPIIKTSLNIGMIDTPDKGSTKSDGTTCVDANGDKVGKWEEFYTNNPTLYKVELRYTGALTRNAVIWTGFLTPDSWGEDMTYGGTISLVARDMLGTLSEYEFDLTGDVTITQIVQGALTKCKCAMTATMRTSECLQNAGNSQSILNAKINASTFAGKSWYEALEQTLEGVGLILRYDGNNGFDCTSIRYAASHAVEGGENAHTPAFYNRSGYRTLDPAVKQIVEVFNPSIESIAPVEPSADDWTDTGDTLTQHYDTPYPHQKDFTYPKFSLAGGSSFFSGSGAIPYLDDSSDGPRDVPKVGIYFPVNLTTANRTTYKDPSLIAPFSLNLSNLVGTGFVELSEWTSQAGNIHYTFSRYFFDSPTAASVSISVSCRLNGTTYYWYKGWGTSETFFDANFDERITIPEKEGATDYAVHIRCINASEVGDGIIGNPLFVPLGIRIEPIEGNDVYGEYKTTTIYDEENHIEINRTPSIGAINSSTPAAFLPNVLHYGTTPASDKWRWAGENSAGLPLAVVIHQQLLVFNCAQNGNSIFTGDLLDLTSRVSVPGTNYDYFTRSCALLAGDYNCLSGYIEGVTLREIYDWDDVWDGVTPEYTEKESQAKGGTAASGGGGSSSGGGGGSSHTHPNKEVLDGITAEKVTSWDGAVTLAHSHDNKTVLDGISSTKVTAWDGAASKAHEHANKTILDAIQEASITHWDAAYSHSQIGVAATTPSGNPHNTTLAQIVGNADLAAKIIAMTSWFGKDENGVYVEKENGQAVNFFSYGEVTAGGVGSGGSGGSGALYTCADVTAYNNSKVGRSTTEGAQVGDLLAYDGTHWHAVVAPATGVTTFNGRSGAVSLSAGDVTSALGYTPVNKAGDTMTGGLTMEYTLSNGARYQWKNTRVRAGEGGRADSFFVAQKADGTFNFSFGHHGGGATDSYLYIGYNAYDGNNLRVSPSDVSFGGNTIYHSGNLTKSTLGLGNVENKSSATIRSEIVASDIPALDASKITTGQFADARITSASAWNSKWDYNENTIKAVKVNNAGNADTLESHSASYFATASSLGNYLPLSGGTLSNNNLRVLTLSSPASAGGSGISILLDNSEKGMFYCDSTSTRMLNNGLGSPSVYVEGGASAPKFRYNGTDHTVYHSGNCNGPSIPWSASSLTLNGGINNILYPETNGISIRTSNTNSPYFSLKTWSAPDSYYTKIQQDYNYDNPMKVVVNNATIFAVRSGVSSITIGEDGSSNVGIGTTSPSEKLHVAGNILATGEVTAGSDSRWKHSITPVFNGIDAIMRLQPSEWKWNSDNHKGSGLVAQQTREVLPHLVKEDSEGYLHLTYDGLHAYEISALQSHETRIERLERENRELKMEIQRLRS